MAFLKHITLSGFKSIKHMELDLRPLNVLIGANGAGKSNFLSFFKLLKWMFRSDLQLFVGKSGGAESLLFYGAKTASSIDAEVDYAAGEGDNPLRYHVELTYAVVDTLIFSRELVREVHHADKWFDLGTGHRESRLAVMLGAPVEPMQEFNHLMPLAHDVYQFHDTSETSHMRQKVYIHDNKPLRHDAGNLAAILYKLQQRQSPYFRRIVQTIQQIAPWFGEFVIEPLELNENNVQLDWRERDSDQVFGPHQLSDGTLRAMALVTLLLQPPEDMPQLVIIDEPELGLHPYAINVVAGLLKAASVHKQILVATQSVSFLNQFEHEDVIVVEREQVPGERQQWESKFKPLSASELSEWLTEYSLGELWEKNVLGGGPV